LSGWQRVGKGTLEIVLSGWQRVGKGTLEIINGIFRAAE